MGYFKMNRLQKLIIVLFFILLFPPSLIEAARIKDIASIEGVRNNQLIGYGLVVGLKGTGDKESSSRFTLNSLVNMLSRMGVSLSPAEVNSMKIKNVAAVMLTADLPPFSRIGGRIDVLVSSIGDAKSLQGGTLVMSPLRGPDNKVYAVAQGPISIGGFGAESGGSSVQVNHITVGRIPNGALVEAEPPFLLDRNAKKLTLNLHKADFTTSRRVTNAINEKMGGDVAASLDARQIRLNIPDELRGRLVEFISIVEDFQVTPDMTSKIIVNERTGTVVIGQNVRISTVAVSHGNLSMEINTQYDVSQPNPFGEGETVVVPQTSINIQEEKGNLVLLSEAVSIGDLVRALNAVGVTPRDLIAILQAIKASGALEAELEII